LNTPSQAFKDCIRRLLQAFWIYQVKLPDPYKDPSYDLSDPLLISVRIRNIPAKPTYEDPSWQLYNSQYTCEAYVRRPLLTTVQFAIRLRSLCTKDPLPDSLYEFAIRLRSLRTRPPLLTTVRIRNSPAKPTYKSPYVNMNPLREYLNTGSTASFRHNSEIRELRSTLLKEFQEFQNIQIKNLQNLERRVWIEC